MSKARYKESTIRSSVSELKAAVKRTDLLDTERVKAYLARAKISDGRRLIMGLREKGNMISL